MLDSESVDLDSGPNLAADFLCNLRQGAQPLWASSLQWCLLPPGEQGHVRKDALHPYGALRF